MLGMLFGSFGVGVSVPKLGRLGTMKLGNLIVILGCLPQLALNIYAQIFGRFIVGFGAFMVMVTIPIYVSETLPGPIIGKCLTAFNIGISSGYVISSII
jgi:MFS transporter, SP family, galactose:H+ symporter